MTDRPFIVMQAVALDSDKVQMAAPATDTRAIVISSLIACYIGVDSLVDTNDLLIPIGAVVEIPLSAAFTRPWFHGVTGAVTIMEVGNRV